MNKPYTYEELYKLPVGSKVFMKKIAQDFPSISSAIIKRVKDNLFFIFAGYSPTYDHFTFTYTYLDKVSKTKYFHLRSCDLDKVEIISTYEESEFTSFCRKVREKLRGID